MAVGSEDPKEPETSQPSTMPFPLGAELRNGQIVQTSESKLKGSEINSSNHHGRPEDTYLHRDEYTSLLKKHLSIVESELSRLKGPQMYMLAPTPLHR